MVANQDSKERNFSILEIIGNMRTLIALLLVGAFFSLVVPNFLKPENLMIMVKHAGRYSILAIGEAFVILSAEIDLSVGAIVAVVGMIAGCLLEKGLVLPMFGVKIFFDLWVVLLLGLAAGAVLGAINGFVVTRFRIASFIATLGMMYIARGFASLISGGQTFAHLTGYREFVGTGGFSFLGSGKFAGVYYSIWIMLGLFLVTTYITRKTPIGRYIYAVGGNDEAARLSGINVKRVKMFVFTFAGFCSALAGLIFASELMTAHPARGQGFELSAIAAVVLGGTSLKGGRGTIWGAVVGAFVISVLDDGMSMMNISWYWQQVIRGSVIILAVAINQLEERLEHQRALQQQAS